MQFLLCLVSVMACPTTTYQQHRIDLESGYEERQSRKEL